MTPRYVVKRDGRFFVIWDQLANTAASGRKFKSPSVANLGAEWLNIKTERLKKEKHGHQLTGGR